MRKSIWLALAVGVSAPAFAQVHVDIALPSIRFAAPPPLVEIEPGVQVVQDNDDEVFFVDGWYWHQRDGHWFRSHDHLGHWAVVEAGIVPPRIVAYHPGTYRNWHAPRREEPAVRREAVRHEEKPVRKEEKHEEHDEHHR